MSLRWIPLAGEVRNNTMACRKGQQILKKLTTDTKVTVTGLEPDTCYTLEGSAEFVNGNISELAGTQEREILK